MRRVRLAGSLPLIISASLAAQPAALQPTSKWVVNYADDLCMLERNYGAAGKTLAVGFEPEVMGQGQEFIIIKSGQSSSVADRKIRLSADGRDIEIEGRGYSTRLQNSDLARIGFDLTNEEVALIRNAAVLSVDAGPGRHFQFAVPGLSKALVALEACRSDLVSGWGMSSAQQLALAAPATPLRPLHTYFKPDDFPTGAIGISGKARVRLTIDEAGTVSQCVVIHSAGNMALDKASCAVIQQRARFTPAQDKAGRPMSSFQVSVIVWLSQ